MIIFRRDVIIHFRAALVLDVTRAAVAADVADMLRYVTMLAMSGKR